MASLLEFRVYAPQLATVPDVQVNALLARATRWSTRVITSQLVSGADRSDAECAYSIYLLQNADALIAARVSGTRKLGDASVTRGADDLAASEYAAASWEARAWQHLYDGGYPFAVDNIGVAR